MNKFKVGLIAGCLNNQKGINRDELYHNVLLKLLCEQTSSDKYQICLGSYLSYNKLPMNALYFIEKKKPDLICFFIRSYPLMPLHKPIIRFEKANNKTEFALHPQLFKRKLQWNKRLTEFQSINEYSYKKRKLIELKDMNIFLGKMLGLHRWAFNYIWQQILTIQLKCELENIQVILISPAPYRQSLLENMVSKVIASKLKKQCTKEGIDYIDISNFSLDYFDKDRIHLNPLGHKVLGSLIYEQIIKQEQTFTHSQLPPLHVSTKATL